MIITTIDTTGEPVNILQLPDLDHIAANYPSGGNYVNGVPPENSYYANGAWVTKPAQPTPAYTWDKTAKQWIDQRTLAQVQADQWEEIKAARDAALVAPLASPYGIFDANTVSQKRITDAIMLLQAMAAAGTPATIDFTLHDNTVTTLTVAQMVNVGMLLGQQSQAAFAKARAYRAAINSATTAAAVAAITWN